MLAGARRGRRKPAIGLRDPAADAEPRAGVGAAEDEPGSLRLRLALSHGSLGLEITEPVHAGPVELSELNVRLAGVRFPVDLSGGVRRFRHVRGQLRRARIELPLLALANALLPRARRAMPDCQRLVIASSFDGLFVGAASHDAAIAFDIVVAPIERHVRLLVECARADGLSLPAQVLACRLTDAMLAGEAERLGSAFILRDPFLRLCRVLLPDAGARVPSTDGVQAYVDVVDDGRAGRLALVVDADAAPARLGPRAVRALETCELFADADEAAFAGDAERARAAYLEALERAPRHPEGARRLASLDLAHGERAEAALSTMVDVTSPIDAGLLGSEILEAVADIDGAYAAAARAASEEPFAWLSARAWLRAARLAGDRAAAAAALDEALVRAPSLELARWDRVSSRLTAGDARGALGDVEHLEAHAPSKEARHATMKRAGELFFDRGFLEQAERLFERALRYDPRSAPSVAGLAKALRDRGKTARALDLFARAAVLAGRDAATAHVIALELAQALASYANDLPSAIARVAAIPQESDAAPRARIAEAGWRAELGDSPGAARCLSRLRYLAEIGGERRASAEGRREDVGADALVVALLEAARLDDQVLRDLRSSRRDLELALALQPGHAQAARQLAAVIRRGGGPPAAALVASTPERTEARAMSAPSREEPKTEAPLAHVPAAEDEAALDQLAQTLTARLRSDPGDQAVVDQLSDVLERLGRDLELLALLSARLEEVSGAEVPSLLERRKIVLIRLADAARGEGRLEEASLYEAMSRAD